MVCRTNAKTASQREKWFFLAVSATEWIAIKSSAPVWLRKPPLRFYFTFRILMPPSEALLCDGARGSFKKWDTWSLSFRRLLRICRNGFLSLSRFLLRSLSRLSIHVEVSATVSGFVFRQWTAFRNNSCSLADQSCVLSSSLSQFRLRSRWAIHI